LRDVSDSATDFENTRAQFAGYDSVLPGKVVLRHRHALLIFDRVTRAKNSHEQLLGG